MGGARAAQHAGPPDAGAWRARAHSLCASGRCLLALPSLAGLGRLRRANFSGNRLLGVEGLQGCSALTELDLSNNCLVQVRLRRLSQWGSACHRGWPQALTDGRGFDKRCLASRPKLYANSQPQQLPPAC
jgi:hypothetical protein